MSSSYIAENNSEYKSREYWEKRFEKEDEYEWLVSYSDVSAQLKALLNPTDHILVIGCGNSRFSADLYDAGFVHITNIDYSETVIEKMRELNKHRELMNWKVMDMTALTFPDSCFDVVLDKAAMDAVMVDEGDVWDPEPSVIDTAHRMCLQISRVLTDCDTAGNAGGLHMQISFAQPHFRTKYLMGLRYSGPVANHYEVVQGRSTVYPWTLEVQKIQSDKGGFDNFLYIMRKDKEENAEEGRHVWYFAIGSMLNKTSMKLRGLRALESRPGRILDYSIRFYGVGGYAEARTAPGQSFHGVLHRMTEADMAVLDRIELDYTRQVASVQLYDDSVVQACVYCRKSFEAVDDLPPTQRYIEVMVEGCLEHGVDPVHIAFLQSVPVVPRRRTEDMLAYPVPDDTPTVAPDEDLAARFGRYFVKLNGKVLLVNIERVGFGRGDAYMLDWLEEHPYVFGSHYELVMSRMQYDPRYGEPPDDIAQFSREQCAAIEDRIVSTSSALARVVARFKQSYKDD